MRKIRLLSILMSLTILVMLAACSGNGNTTTSTSSTGGLTFGQLAVSGQTVFTGRCASCHEGGSGPALTGQNNNLKSYGNAASLLSRISATMPTNAPGSLTQQQYWDVLAYLLVQDGFVTSQTTFDANNLSQVPLA